MGIEKLDFDIDMSQWKIEKFAYDKINEIIDWINSQSASSTYNLASDGQGKDNLKFQLVNDSEKSQPAVLSNMFCNKCKMNLDLHVCPDMKSLFEKQLAVCECGHKDAPEGSVCEDCHKVIFKESNKVIFKESNKVIFKERGEG